MNFDKVSALGETGILIKDLSQYGNNGSGMGGITWTGNGKWNGGYQFDGINDYVSTSINNLPLTNLTIAFWAYEDANNGGRIFGYENASN
ncbi:TPA: hypothetical protein DCZ39_03845 [Patescibacteria group bacterium]|nr:hypothetical protein [Candidatus Gracilibacteria bacterium]